MNVFKAVSSSSCRKGWWSDFCTNRKIKRQCRRKARHNLKKGLDKQSYM